jgi:hypothetical protein
MPAEEQAINEAFEVDEELENQELPDDESEDEGEQEDVAGQQEKPENTKSHPADKIYIDKETWIKQGRDPDKWISPEWFRDRTEKIQLKSMIAQQQKEFNRRLELNNRMHQVQLDRQRQELESRKENAILEADTKEVKRIDKELRDIDALEQTIKPAPVEQSNVDPAIAEWNADNDWLVQGSKEQILIQEEFVRNVNEGKTVATALRRVDDFIKRNNLRPQLQAAESSQKKTPRAIVDSPKGGAVVKSQSNLSWESLSSQEKSIYDELYADAGVSKKEYLQSVADSKKGL